ncbi:adenosine deaminase [Longibacter salinarum]|uniref:adenosine deaminase n=1 Tax=Longibacter salinarum TaxID=1850348 RepID=A0A2A8CX93_9BACT|nr:adenosine deaminase [Longibacter salinarum]PEN13369.1 adenosine deaminase [Longibacter salinarum]
MTLTRDDILDWPKAELHCHLDGSLRLDTMIDIAEKEGKMQVLPSDTVEGLKEILREVDNSETLEAYLAWFRYTIPLLQTKEALYRCTYELAEDNAKENVRHLELRYAPILHTEEGLSLEEVNETVLQALKDAERDLDINTGLIICGLRDRYESASMRQAELAAEYRHRGVVAFDLAGGEAGNPPKGHLHAFYHARNHLLNLTVHAGESWGPDSIRQALFYCGAHRIGHGISLQEDPELMQYFADHRIPLEMCPTSNVQTHVVPSLEAHPITTYVKNGVPVTVNTDNRLFSRTSVTDELWSVYQYCDIDAEELREVAINGFRYAFIRRDEKQALLRSVIDDFPLAPSDETPVW